MFPHFPDENPEAQVQYEIRAKLKSKEARASGRSADSRPTALPPVVGAWPSSSPSSHHSPRALGVRGPVSPDAQPERLLDAARLRPPDCLHTAFSS